MLVYVCSRFRGDPPYSRSQYRRNLRDAVRYTRYVIAKGHTPVTPHLFFQRVLDDRNSAEREIGCTLGLSLLQVCDEVWVFGPAPYSAGMLAEIDHAKALHIPVHDLREV